MVIEVGGAAFLYVIGGTSSWHAIYDDVLRARIEENGSLGAFEQVGKLPETRAGHAAVVVDKHIVISGGHTMSGAGMATLDSTIVATVDDDGRIGPWTTGPKLPTAVMHHTCNAVGRWIYCVGGRIDGNFTSSLAVRTSVTPEGGLTPYEAIAPLDQSIGFHQAFVYEHALYIAGGLHRDAPMADFDRLSGVSRLAIADDGSVGTWQKAGELPEPRSLGAAQTFRDRVYFFGGANGNDEVLSTILSGTLTPEGRVADVRGLSTKLSIARMHVHQTPMYRTWIYSVGGRDVDEHPLKVIDIGAFD